MTINNSESDVLVEQHHVEQAAGDITLDEIAGMLSLPEVQPHIEGNQAPENSGAQADDAPPWEPAPVDPFPGLKDKHGRSFDPAYHEVGEDGQPTLNRDGFLKLKPGRPRLDGSTIASPKDVEPEVVPTTAAQAPQTDSRERAEGVVCIFLAAFEQLGPDWQATEAEYNRFVSATDRLMQKYQMQAPGPEVELAGCIVLYAAVRLRKQENRDKLAPLVVWLKQKLIALQSWFAGFRRKGAPGA